MTVDHNRVPRTLIGHPGNEPIIELAHVFGLYDGPGSLPDAGLGNADKPLPPVSPELVAACKEKRRDFGEHEQGRPKQQ